MANQISKKQNGKQLLESLKRERDKIIVYIERVKKLLALLEKHNECMRTIMKKFSKEDLELYKDQFDKIEKQLTKLEKDITF